MEFGKRGKRLKNKQWFFILALFLVSLNLRPAITSIGPLLTQIQADLSMNALTASLITAIPVFCMGIFAPLAGILSSRLGIDWSILLCICLVGLATAARFVVHTSVILLVSAFLVGVGVAIIGPLLSGFIKHHFPEQAPTMIGIYSVGIGVGATLSAGLAIPFATSFHSWKSALGIWALLAVVGFFIWLPILRGSRPQEAEGPATKRRLPWDSGRAWVLLIAFGLQSGIYYSVTTWLSPKTEELGYSQAAAGIVLTTFSVIQMCCSLVIPMLVNRSRSRKPWLVGSGVLTLLGLTLCAFWTSPVSPWFAAAVLGVGLGGLFPILLILPLDETRTADEASRWTAMMQCGGYIMSGIVPMLAGAIKDSLGSYRYSFMALMILAICLVVTSVFLNKREEQLDAEAYSG
ncbi:MFS transporter [Alicyclobacillus fastidiosus]|nr:MFS transporter [Alicyclobacillus fastidiosus]